jgi:GMP synthase (glutamine-hydrolysing)
MVIVEAQGQTKISSVGRNARILILNCDFDQNPMTNGAELIKSALRVVSVDRINVFENAPDREMLAAYNGLVITGSEASVYHKSEWISDLFRTIQEVDRLGIPTLGICFGFQAVAESAGGRVIGSGKFEVGFRSISLTEEGVSNFIFEGLPRRLIIYESHGDVLERLPYGASVLAENAFSMQGFQLNNFTCVQGHPEIRPDIAAIMAERDGDNLKTIMNGVKRDYASPLRILENFLGEVELRL